MVLTWLNQRELGGVFQSLDFTLFNCLEFCTGIFNYLPKPESFYKSTLCNDILGRSAACLTFVHM